MTSEPIPQRLSDADRDAAAGLLREHYEAGRLDAGEFSDRLDVALRARFAADIAPLFVDLPEPHPLGIPDLSPPGPSRAVTSWAPGPGPVPAASAPNLPAEVAKWVPMAKALVWPVAILMGLMTGELFWWIAFAIVGSIILNQLTGGGKNNRKPPPYLQR